MHRLPENFFNPDEELQFVLKKHWLTLLKPVILSLLFVSLPFLLIVPLWRLEIYGVVLFFVFIVIGLTLFLRSFLIWYFSSYVVTDQRVIDVERAGLLKEEINSVYLEEIEEVIFKKKGLNQIVCDFGTIEIHIKKKKTLLVWPNIKRPKKIYTLLNDLRQQRIKEVKQPSPIQTLRQEFSHLMDAEVVDLLFELKKSIGERRFEKIIKRFGVK